MKIVDIFELEPGGRYRHNKTAVEYTLTDVKQLTFESFRIQLTDDNGKSFNVEPAILENLYTKLEPAEPIAPPLLPIGSVAIDGPDPEPAQDPEPEPELIFRRSGRPAKPTAEIQSYFGEPRKHGPRKNKC
jgi:hypothetical protein